MNTIKEDYIDLVNTTLEFIENNLNDYEGTEQMCGYCKHYPDGGDGSCIPDYCRFHWRYTAELFQVKNELYMLGDINNYTLLKNHMKLLEKAYALVRSAILMGKECEIEWEDFPRLLKILWQYSKQGQAMSQLYYNFTNRIREA